jgi:hypothetical protein
MRELEKTVPAIVDYLTGLAPRFFAERRRGASEAEIDRLQQAASVRLADGHREFLRHFGGCAATVLNPFLNDRDLSIAALVKEYGYEQTLPSLPPGVVLFSASEFLGEIIYLENGAAPADEPRIGELRFAPGQTEGPGVFVPRSPAGFFDYLLDAAFTFRISQPEHGLAYTAPWDAEREAWPSATAAVEQVLVEQGFRFQFQAGARRCFDPGDLVADVFVGDGSGEITGDDEDALEQVRNVLVTRVGLDFRRQTTSWRMFAPRA